MRCTCSVEGALAHAIELELTTEVDVGWREEPDPFVTVLVVVPVEGVYAA